MTLITDWRAALRQYSTIALAILSSVGGAWVGIPDTFKTNFPGWVAQTVSWIVLAVAVFGLVGKFIDQDAPPKDAP